MTFLLRCSRVLLAGMGALLALTAGAAGRAVPAETSARVIVAFKPGAALLSAQALSATTSRDTLSAQAQRRANGLATRAGVPLTAGRLFAARSMVVKATGLDSDTLAARLSAHPDVAYAVPDRRRRAFAVPNDPLFTAGPTSGLGPAVGQWYLRTPDSTIRSAVNAQGAWDRVTGAASVVVAVLDTGVLAGHPDLAGQMLPGQDLIEDLDTANDGNGRDADASDPGDWITGAEDAKVGGPFQGCGAQDSVWHGTQVAGIIGASADNGIGMAGAAHGVRILPVRVLGKCGGFDSDIIAGLYWAVGIDQDGLPGSATPARVLNLSLGGTGACSRAYRTAVAEIAAPPYNAVVVAAAGNSSGHAVGTPANCPGVVGVAGLRHTGSKSLISDVGAEVTIAAPAGNCVNIDFGSPCLYPILSTSNSGTRGPVAGGWIWTDSFNFFYGTSFSAPMVSSALALMLSVRPNLTPAQLIATIKRTARPFPTSGSDNGIDDPTPVPMCHAPDGTDQLQCYCVSGLCGAGMLDIAAAVLDTALGMPLATAADQVMDLGERLFPNHFPSHVATLSTGPLLYRYYPSTRIYLGVAVQSDSATVMGGVYVLGGPWGNNALYLGTLTDFVTPR